MVNRRMQIFIRLTIVKKVYMIFVRAIKGKESVKWKSVYF